jgi:hypothetical protein
MSNELPDVRPPKVERVWSITFRMNYKRFCDSITPPKPFVRGDKEWKLLETALKKVYGKEEGQKLLKAIRKKEKAQEPSFPKKHGKGGTKTSAQSEGVNGARKEAVERAYSDVLESKKLLETTLERVYGKEETQKLIEAALAPVAVNKETQVSIRGRMTIAVEANFA